MYGLQYTARNESEHLTRNKPWVLLCMAQTQFKNLIQMHSKFNNNKYYYQKIKK